MRRRYVDGALINAVLARDVFPGWRMRLYYDHTAPAGVVADLRRCVPS